MLQSKHLRVIALMILLVGLGSAGAVYLTVEPTPVNSSEYDRFASKKYVRDLERFGGKFAVVTAELSEWFAGLWQGRALAATVGILSLALAALLWFVSTCMQIDEAIDRQDPGRKGD